MALVMMAILARSEYCSLRCRVISEREVAVVVVEPEPKPKAEPEARLPVGEGCLTPSNRGIG